MAHLVHAIVDASAPELGAEVSGVSRAPMTDGLHALLSEVDGRVRPTRELLRRHAEVNDAAATVAGSVLPLRFGHVVDDPAELEDGPFASRAEELRRMLERIEGRVETRIRIRFDEQAAIALVAERDDTVRRLRGRQDRESRIELGVAVSRGLEQLRTSIADRIVDVLVPLVDDHRVHDRRDDLDVLDLSVLHDGDEGPLVDRLEDVLNGAPATAEVAGPLPPYSFAEVSSWDS